MVNCIPPDQMICPPWADSRVVPSTGSQSCETTGTLTGSAKAGAAGIAGIDITLNKKSNALCHIVINFRFIGFLLYIKLYFLVFDVRTGIAKPAVCNKPSLKNISKVCQTE
jgi:hypothetical protein